MCREGETAPLMCTKGLVSQALSPGQTYKNEGSLRSKVKKDIFRSFRCSLKRDGGGQALFSSHLFLPSQKLTGFYPAIHLPWDNAKSNRTEQLLTGASKNINQNYDRKLKKHANKLIFNQTYTSEPTTVKGILPHENVVAPTTAMVKDRAAQYRAAHFSHTVFSKHSHANFKIKCFCENGYIR